MASKFKMLIKKSVNRFRLFHSKIVLGSLLILLLRGEHGGSVVECRTPEREVRGSRPTSAVLCP